MSINSDLDIPVLVKAAAIARYVLILGGGAGSGNHGHAGRAGLRGGSGASHAIGKLSPFWDWSNATTVGRSLIADDGTRLSVALMDGDTPIASMVVQKHANNQWTASGTLVAIEGQGLGMEMYLDVMRYLKQTPWIKDGVLTPEFKQTDAAKALWTSLRRRTDVVAVGNGLTIKESILEGGAGSGNHAHKGRAGLRGGSTVRSSVVVVPVEVGRQPVGRRTYNAPQIVTMSDGRKWLEKDFNFAGEIDPVLGHPNRPPRFRFEHQRQAELLAYEVGQMLDVNVPETVAHGENGTRQLFVSGELALNFVGGDDNWPIDIKFNAEASMIGRMDFITGNSDRHHQNWMIDRNVVPDTGQHMLIAIDNGASMPQAWSALEKIRPGGYESHMWKILDQPLMQSSRNLRVTEPEMARLRRVATAAHLPAGYRERAQYLVEHEGVVPVDETDLISWLYLRG